VQVLALGGNKMEGTAKVDNRGKHVKQKWEESKKLKDVIAQHDLNFTSFGLTAHDVFSYLHKAAKESGALTPILEGVQITAYMDLLRRLPEYDKMYEAHAVEAKKPKLYKPKKQRVYSESLIDGPADQIKVAIWFIKKLGSVDIARKAIEAAAAALDKLK